MLSESQPWPHPPSLGDAAFVEDTEFGRTVTICGGGMNKGERDQNINS